jgi:hypothetical protein
VQLPGLERHLGIANDIIGLEVPIVFVPNLDDQIARHNIVVELNRNMLPM